MALKTLVEQIEERETALSAIAAGAQSASVDGATVTKANVAELWKQVRNLRARYLRSLYKRPNVSYADLRGNFD